MNAERSISNQIPDASDEFFVHNRLKKERKRSEFYPTSLEVWTPIAKSGRLMNDYFQ
jgi:hypothetical protein